MKVIIHLEGSFHVINVRNQPIEVSEIKQRIHSECGVPVASQTLWDYQADGMRVCKSTDTLNADMSNKQINLVLQMLDGVSAWAYFHICFSQSYDNVNFVMGIAYHKFAKIAALKQFISSTAERPLSSIQLQNANRNVLNDNSNLYQCGVTNGARLYCLFNLFPLPRL